jgi:16S rRNA (uracil1498-N3)-methyltransferase
VARFFLPSKSIQNQRGTVVGEELDHMRRVLRMKPGDRVTVFDDTGWEHEAIVRAFSAGQGEIDILSSHPADRESSLATTLAVGLTKGEKIDLVIEKATELGIQTIVPFVSAYTVPRLELDEGKIERRARRWAKIAVSAAKQCGRSRIPKILPLRDFQGLVSQPRPDMLKLLFWEREGQRTLKEVHDKVPHAGAVLLVIGPEGGFSLEEAKAAQQHGFESIHLGRRTLRAETAAVTAVSLVQFLWGDLG